MIELIQSEFRKIVLKCINRYAKDNSQSPDNVQVILSLKEADAGVENAYTMCVDYAKKEEYTIMQVLGLRVDFLGYSKLAPPFITKSLIRFAQKHESLDVCVMCMKTENEKGKEDIRLILYKGNEYIEDIEFAELFNEEDMLDMPQT